MNKSNKGKTNNAKRRVQRRQAQARTNYKEQTRAMVQQAAQLPSPCAIKYSAALSDPFQPVAGACVPDTISTPSLKVRTLKRGNFSAGTTGVAFIAVRPWQISNDGTMGYYSNTSYAGTTIDATAGTGKVAFTNSQGPFATADLGATTHQGRVVGMGLRVRYVGTTLNKGGKMVMLREPLNQTLSGLSMDDLLDFQEVDSHVVGTEWKTVAYRPMSQQEIEYQTNVPSFVTYCLGCLITGTTASNPFEYQVVQYLEYTGASYGTSVSHSDPAAMGHIRNHVAPSSAASTSIWRRVVDGITGLLNGHLVSSGLKAIQNKAWSYAKDVVMGMGTQLLEGVGKSLLLGGI